MSNLLNATLKPLWISEEKPQKEFKIAPFGLLNAFKESSRNCEVLTPSVREKIRTTQHRALYLKAINNNTLPVATAKSFVIPTNFSTTSKTQITFVTLAVGRHFAEEMYFENEVKYQEDMEDFFIKAGRDLAGAVETYCLAALEAYKSQKLPYNSAALEGLVFDDGTDTLNLSYAAQATRWWEKMETVMEENGLTGDKLIIASPGIKNSFADNKMYGVSNDKNLDQLFPNFYTSRNVTNTGRFTAYVIENGAFGMESNFQQTYLKGDDRLPGTNFGVTRFSLPYLEEPVEYLHKFTGVDLSGMSSDFSRFQTVVGEEMAFFHSFAIIHPFNSDIANTVNPNIKVVGAAS